MRLRKKWWARPEMEASPKVVITPSENKGRWKEEFNNDKDIFLELGCGRGRFITHKALNNPDNNYVAVDLKDEVLIYALRKLEDNEVSNARIVPMNIAGIEEVFEEDEISGIFINFCNPWPKERHKKRRLTHPRFLSMYKKFLKDQGEIWFKTDDKGLFEESLDYFKESGFQVIYHTFDLHNSGFQENIMTEYEEKFSSKGMNIMFLIAKYNKE